MAFVNVVVVVVYRNVPLVPIPPAVQIVLAAVETAWLFTKGSQSVRVIRAATLRGEIHLHIHGPSATRESYTFHDVVDCMHFQADYERRLVAQGFSLERFTSDRRLLERERRSRRRG